MTKIAASLIFLLALIAPAISQGHGTCPVSGAMEHWRADYCMAQSETDDVIAAQPCLDREAKVLFRSECAAKLHYKREMCKLSVGKSVKKIGVCMKDKSFVGPTVRNHGA